MKQPDNGIAKKILGIVAAGCVVALGTSAPARRLLDLPRHLTLFAGQDLIVPWSRWLPLSVTGPVRELHRGPLDQLDITASRPGHYQLHLAWFGRIPWRGVPVDVGKPLYAVPGGESVGIVAHTDGLILTGFAPVSTSRGIEDPARDAGLERGDVIVRVDGNAARSAAVLMRRVAQDGAAHRPVQLWVRGARTDHARRVLPVWSAQQRGWQIGAVLQDKTSGVGTLTFYNPRTLQFAALGHSVSEGMTRRPVHLAQGRVTGAEIVGLVPATDQQPGQKVGVLAGPSNVSGTTDFNGRFGVVGQLNHRPIWGPRQPLPVALPDQVHTGPAEIITVISGQLPQHFHVNIIKTAPQTAPNVKGLMLQVTDPRLLRQAGGIIQGMSGSPIVQQGRLVGAVTHVLINRPHLGFGCYAYWMAQQSGYKLQSLDKGDRTRAG